MLAGGAPVDHNAVVGHSMFWAQFDQQQSTLVDALLEKFLTYAKRVNMLFKAGKWQTSFKDTIKLLMGAMIKHPGASDIVE